MILAWPLNKLSIQPTITSWQVNLSVLSLHVSICLDILLYTHRLHQILYYMWVFVRSFYLNNQYAYNLPSQYPLDSKETIIWLIQRSDEIFIDNLASNEVWWDKIIVSLKLWK